MAKKAKNGSRPVGDELTPKRLLYCLMVLRNKCIALEERLTATEHQLEAVRVQVASVHRHETDVLSDARYRLLHDAIAQMTTMQARMAALERRGTVPIDQTSRSE